MRQRISWLAALFAALFIVGCGGGGGGSSDSGTALTRVFATDQANPDADHLWVTVYRVELIKAGGGTDTVFQSDTGVTLDLAALGETNAQQFVFLGSGNVDQAIYSGARVTLGEDIVVFPTGATNGVPRQLVGAASGRTVLDVQFPTPQVFGSTVQNVVIAFNSADWATVGAQVTATLATGAAAGIDDPANQEGVELRGTISSLSGTAPGQTFTLSLGTAGAVQVQTSGSTVLLTSGGAVSPSLANGQFVEVDGIFNPSTGRIEAIKVRIEDGPGDIEDEDEVRGVVSNINSAGGSFSVAATTVFGFLPSQSTVNVQVSDTTKFFGDSGVSISRTEFFSRLQSTTVVEAEGTYNSATNTLTAKSVKLEDDALLEDRAEAHGTVSNLNVGARTFTLTVSAFQGLFTSVGAQVNVSIQPGAELLSDSGTTLSESDFFLALPTAAGVEVEGTYDAATNTFLASKVKLDDEVGGVGGVEIEGTASSINTVAQTLTITVFEWEGGFFSSGQQVVVVAQNGATFEDDDGNPLTAAQFFAAISAGTRVDARGTVQNGQLLANRLRIKD